MWNTFCKATLHGDALQWFSSSYPLASLNCLVWDGTAAMVLSRLFIGYCTSCFLASCTGIWHLSLWSLQVATLSSGWKNREFCESIFFLRYLTLIYSAMHSLRNKSSFSKDKNWVYRQESDICMLHLFKSFMGAAPQLILQLYIIAVLHHASIFTGKLKFIIYFIQHVT